MRFNIWEDYQCMDLPDVLSFIVDNRGKTVPTDPEGKYILIATNCIRNEHLYPSYEKIRTVNEETYLNWFRAHPEPGDIIFVNKGTPGRVCMVPDPVDFCIAQDMIAFRVNPEIVYNKYLFAVLRSSKIQNQIAATTVGDVIPHFKKQHLHEIKVPIPPMEIQQIIGDYYYSFCKKETLNEKINRNLLEQAQVLYKSWFVDLEPFDGERPADWKDGIVNDLASEVICGKTPSTKKEEYYGDDIPFVTIPDMHGCVYTVHTERSLSKLGAESQSKKMLPKDSICVSCIGTAGLVTLLSVPSQTNQQINSIIPKANYSPYYIYLLMSTMKETINKLGQAGSTIVNLNKTEFGKMEVLIPSIKVMGDFDEIAEPIFNTILSNQIENTKLSSLRDTLLPKLMSGELDVSDKNF